MLFTGIIQSSNKMDTTPIQIQEESRKDIPDSDFGLPSKRKYPMHDKKHVKLAVQMFNYVDEEDEEELAKNIKKKIKQYGIEDEINPSKDNRFYKYWNAEAVNESYNIPLHPVYIVTVYTGSTFGKLIRAYTGDTYSHSSVGLNHDLSKLYSFNATKSVSINGNGGLSLESLNQYIHDNKEAVMQVSVVFLKNKDYSALQDRLEWFMNNAMNTRYDFGDVFNIALNRAVETKDDLTMICSQFVDSLFKIIDVDLSGKSSNLTTPGDLSRISNPKVYKVFEGKAVDYRPKKIGNKIKNLLKKAAPIKEMVLFESKEFPVQFDEDGNLLIKNYKTVDYKEEYYKSVKLLKTYKDTDNMEGMKYELSKLWFISEVLSKKINSTRVSPEEKKEYLELKKKVLNTFSQYLKIVSSKEKDFNFNEYYESTPFSDTKIKINGSTINHGINLVKKIIKP